MHKQIGKTMDKGKIKTRTWIIAIAALAACCVAAFLLINSNRQTGDIVEVIQDGKVIEEIDLSLVAEEYSFTVEAEGGGYNVITVRPGAICVSESDCPDKVCVNERWLYSKDMPIVCMPHKLMIRYKSAGEVDAVAN